jgi:OmpA-OmpF porin, OOP family
MIFCFAMASGAARAQSVLSALLGESTGVSVNTGLLNLSLLAESADPEGLLSVEILSSDALLGVGVSGQDILLLGAPSESDGSVDEMIMPLLDLLDPDQASVVEFLEETALNGDIEPTVLTVTLPGISVSNEPQPKTVDTRQDQRRSNAEMDKPENLTLQLAKQCEDLDQDSVCDSLDQCPNSPAEAIVLPSGCHFDVDVPLELRGVEFEVDTARLTRASENILAQIARALRRSPKLLIEVAGHTDDTGDFEYNSSLSRARANAVRAFLISKGVPPYRLEARGYGAAEPKVDVTGLSGDALESARARNRRVELRMISSTTPYE